MELKQLISDERGVSPVIGVILMVAITVILAAVIGTFVLGLGSSVGNSQAPQATFNYQYSGFGSGSSTQYVNVTDQGGDSIQAKTLNLSVPIKGSGSVSVSVTGTTSPNVTINGSPWSGKVTAGDTLSVSSKTGNTIAGGQKVNLVWKSSSGSSSIISSSTTPSS